MNSNLATLTVKKQESLSSIEDKLSSINSVDEFKIRLPSSLNTHGALGIEAAVIQLYGTWLRTGDYEKIFHSFQSDENDFEKLCASIYGICALSLSDKIWSKDKSPLKRNEVLKGAVDTIENLRENKFEQCFKSRYFGIPLIKKLGYNKEFFMPVYRNNEVINSHAFYRLVENVFEGNINGTSRFKTLDRTIGKEDLSDLIWEIFKNTHDHGRIDRNNNELKNNFRAIIIQQIDISNTYLNDWCGKNPSNAQRAFKDLLLNSNSEKHPILDISIIDMGAGFIDLAKEKSSENKDIPIFLNCLRSGWSRLLGNNRGDGLTKVLSNIHKHKGWLRIRTGNILLEKTYGEYLPPTPTGADVKKLEDSAVGTTIHISIPLNI